jgi:N-acylneuraminate cytidylyltransferase
MNSLPTCIALIPARGGSKRIPGKNIRRLAGHPLIAYTVCAARASGVFKAVQVATDDPLTAAIARHYGAFVPSLRPEAISGEFSADFEWLEYVVREWTAAGLAYETFSILRPTSPFRLPATIRRAWGVFAAATGADSLRAVEKCRQHPGKMWLVEGDRMTPLLPRRMPNGQPWHSTQYQALPTVYTQNASLEIAWTRVVHEHRNISGEAIVPFFTEGLEGFDINRAEDWERAELLLGRGEAVLPEIDVNAWKD